MEPVSYLIRTTTVRRRDVAHFLPPLARNVKGAEAQEPMQAAIPGAQHLHLSLFVVTIMMQPDA
eukprot:3731284-Amphidinium_carterae.1